MWEKFRCLLLRTELQGGKGSLLLLRTLIKGMAQGWASPDMEVVPFKTSSKPGDLGVAANICLTGMSGATWL